MISLKHKLFNSLIIWVLLSSIFFIVELCTHWIEAYSTAKLAAGGAIEGLFVFIGLKIAIKVANNNFFLCSYKNMCTKYTDFFKTIIILAACSWQGVLTLSRINISYVLRFDILHCLFLLIMYPIIAIMVQKKFLITRVGN